MNKYIYFEECSDYSEMHGLVANSYKEAEEKVMQKFANALDDPKLNEVYDYKEFMEKLYDEYGINISYIEDIEEINYY